MAWNSLITWVSGVLSAAAMNAQIRDNLAETAPAKVTAAGDLVQGTGNHAIARLPIGTPYQHLRVNAAGNGVEWTSVGVMVQRVKSGGLFFSATPGSTSYADITDATVSITPRVTGSRLRCYLVNDGSAIAEFETNKSSSGSNTRVFVGLHDNVEGGLQQECNLDFTGDASSLSWSIVIPPSAVVFDYYWSVAGARTIKLQYDSATSCNFSLIGCTFVVEEWLV